MMSKKKTRRTNAPRGAPKSPGFELDTGLLIVFSVLVFIIGGYAVLFSAFLPLTGIPILDTIATDTHYKYFVFLIIPMGTYFIIANWVGWQYYQNS
ncbi:hypothetical protein SCHPADRAFT_852410 [Schizopora paradoxa]|uniref:PIG-P-domain-containing protein n=1 Tax=Schizopora paradoxa TaxID=27342 RepID=A0A0H2RPK3_9AGAM|nr:hypothetical protein SCHPADRAFT_852410 [Schizopora paradoxa]